MSLFIEASGYSKTDVDAAYQEGLNDGASATLQGDATQAQVLEGYTFSSRVAGSGKQGLMANRGFINQSLNPGGEYVERTGAYHTGIHISANPNTQTQSVSAEQTDLGLQNLVRYINAKPYGDTRYGQGQTAGYAQAMGEWFNNVSGKYLCHTQIAKGEAGTLTETVTPTKNGLLLITLDAWRATTASPRTFPNVSNFTITGATLITVQNTGGSVANLNPEIINTIRHDTTGNTSSATGSHVIAIAKCTANTTVSVSFAVEKSCQIEFDVVQIGA